MLIWTRCQLVLHSSRRLSLIAALLVTGWTVGCDSTNRAGKPGESQASGGPPFTLAAASSLANLMDDALKTWNAQNSGRGQATYASSSTLARQIEQGAPVDLYVSANQAWMDHLAARGLIDVTSRRNLTHNTLVLIQPRGSPEHTLTVASDRPPPALSGLWSTGDPRHVPVGSYARDALGSLGWWEELRPRLISASDARGALRLVERNEVDWGIVYQTDARMSDAVRVAARLPAETHDPIVYPAALTPSQHPHARAFLDWLSGPEGHELLRANGFPSFPSTALAQP
ncbi:molybdate ABC transporter substrate-binding protein [Myxococcota bacterium]|nr:molybdate ABC transporter substrate-binding protein [Myxococcota bacterium]